MKKKLIWALFVLINVFAQAQTSFIPLSSIYYHLLDRQEIKSGKLSDYHTSFKPYAREKVFSEVKANANDISKADSFNTLYLLKDNSEYLPIDSLKNQKPILKYFYQYSNSFYSARGKDYFVIANPVISVSAGKSNLVSNSLFLNTRGIEVRGGIGKNVGFYTFMSDNQTTTPFYVQQYVSQNQNLPGEGFYKPFKTNSYDFLSARGYVTLKANKYIDLQFGHDKNFIGNGFRSLVLSDFANPSLFLKIQTQFWKIKYTNLFTELKANSGGTNQYYGNKYMTLHHLSLNVTKNFNLGLFESIVFRRNDSIGGNHFDFSYMNPIIFYRWAEQNNGSLDNANIGLDAKLNLFKSIQLYGTVFIDELLVHDFLDRNGAWTNKQAFQFGGKYINVAKIKNLDFQYEYNYIRPYVYSHFNNYSNYTHYGQALAHPLGANLKEHIFIVHYQPLNGLKFYLQLNKMKQGVDSDNGLDSTNFGGNIFKSYSQVSVHHSAGNEILQGNLLVINNFVLNTSYMLFHNFFVDFSVQNRISSLNQVKTNEKIVNLGVRLNIAPRKYDF